MRGRAATETEEGRRWAESKIKVLTGGDPIAARFMRQDFFEYVPQFKLVIAGNHKPGLRSVNEAIRRRFLLVPFTVTIPPEDRDKELPEKLKAEWPGILAWMIEGCRSWQAHGLDPPEAVTEATEAYLEAEDAMGAWIEECCEEDPQAWTKTTELFNSWRSWALAAEEWVGSTKQFAQKLEDRGLRYQKRHGERGYWGLRLREHNSPEGAYLRKTAVVGTRYEVRVLQETDPGGLQVEYAWGEVGWLPKSAITVGKEREDGTVEIEVPEWLRREKGLRVVGAQVEMKLI
jgi:putative DNA primase/helicase